jgi:antitoxin (DNA-binding transcriptional repressor) of toxin-antitoxin stability system
MIHVMSTATVRDLRTRFPRIRRLLEQEGEVIITHRGQPIVVLRAYEPRAPRSTRDIDYLARLRQRMPKPLTRAARRGLDEAERDER